MGNERTVAVTDARTVFDDLIRFETIAWGAVDARLQAERGLTASSFNLMLVIDATPLCRVFDIAEAVAITVGGASQAVDRLEKAGYGRRTPHPDARRSSIVDLTPPGVEALRAAEPVFDDELARLITAPLSTAHLSQFGSALNTLRRSAHTP
jgi:DNA-binding MarR family transcriptional regulator